MSKVIGRFEGKRCKRIVLSFVALPMAIIISLYVFSFIRMWFGYDDSPLTKIFHQSVTIVNNEAKPSELCLVMGDSSFGTTLNDENMILGNIMQRKFKSSHDRQCKKFVTVCGSAFSSFEHHAFFLSINPNPGLALIGVNLRSFGENWLVDPLWRYQSLLTATPISRLFTSPALNNYTFMELFIELPLRKADVFFKLNKINKRKHLGDRGSNKIFYPKEINSYNRQLVSFVQLFSHLRERRLAFNFFFIPPNPTHISDDHAEKLKADFLRNISPLDVEKRIELEKVGRDGFEDEWEHFTKAKLENLAKQLAEALDQRH